MPTQQRHARPASLRANGALRHTLGALAAVLCLVGVAGATADSTAVDSAGPITASDSTAARSDSAGQPDADSVAVNTALDSLSQSADDAAATEQTAEDTIPFWHSPYLSLHVSWSLGGFPAFTAWENDLPGSLRDFGLESDVITGDSVSGYDTLDLRYDVREEPNSYNVAFPIGLGYTFIATPRQSLAVDAAFWFMYKKQQAVFEIDSLPQQVRTERFLGVYTVGLGLTYRVRIPALYFSVDNTHSTELMVGLTAHPFQYLTRDDDVAVVGEAHSGLADAESAARELSHTVSTFGTGLSWSVGVGSVKRLTGTTGMRTTLSYLGRWYYFSRMDGNGLKTLQPSVEPRDASYVAHRFAITVEFLRGLRTADHSDTRVLSHK